MSHECFHATGSVFLTCVKQFFCSIWSGIFTRNGVLKITPDHITWDAQPFGAKHPTRFAYSALFVLVAVDHGYYNSIKF